MQRTKPVLIAALLGITMHAAAQNLEAAATQPQPGYGFAPTVKKLMQIEAEKAVAAALGQVPQAAMAANTAKEPEPQVPDAPPEPRPVLMLDGIYGHGGRWKAEVSIDGQSYLFAPSQTKAGYRAKHIDARCIELQHVKFPQKLCSGR